MKQHTTTSITTAAEALDCKGAAIRHGGVYLVALRMDADGNPLPRVQVLPAGAFRARDGRPAADYPQLTHWLMDKVAAEWVLADLSARQTPLVIDYEHQTMNTETNGQPAPAAGWVEAVPSWDEQEGLTMAVKWTQRAKDMIRADEYRYLSPVFGFDETTGRVTRLHHVALTNYPALDGLRPVTARHQPPSQESPAMPLNKETLTLLGLGETATLDDIHTAIAALKSATPATPHPAQYVPLAQFETVKTELAALKTRQAQVEVDDLIETGKSSGKLLAAQEQWARDLGNRDVSALRSYLDTTPAIAALKGNQTNGKPPADGGDANQLSDAQVEAVKIGGWDPSIYKGNN